MKTNTVAFSHSLGTKVPSIPRRKSWSVIQFTAMFCLFGFTVFAVAEDTVATVQTTTIPKTFGKSQSRVAYSVPTMEDIILASSFSVPTTEYLKKPRTTLGDIILSLDVLSADGEFRVALHKPSKDNPAEVGEEVAEVFRGTPRSLALQEGKEQEVRFDQKRGLLLPDSDYYVVLYGLSGTSAVAWNVTERAVKTVADTAQADPSQLEHNSQVIWNPEVHRRLLRKGQLATALLPDDNPGGASGNIGGLPLALSAGGAFMMQVTVQTSSLSVPEPATTAALLGAGMLTLVLHLRRRRRPHPVA